MEPRELLEARVRSVKARLRDSCWEFQNELDYKTWFELYYELKEDRDFSPGVVVTITDIPYSNESHEYFCKMEGSFSQQEVGDIYQAILWTRLENRLGLLK